MALGFQLVIGAALFLMMLTWAKGRQILAAQLRKIMPPSLIFTVDQISVEGAEDACLFIQSDPNQYQIVLSNVTRSMAFPVGVLNEEN